MRCIWVDSIEEASHPDSIGCSGYLLPSFICSIHTEELVCNK